MIEQGAARGGSEDGRTRTMACLTVAEAAARCAATLRAADIATPQRDAALLARHALRCTAEQLHAAPERLLSASELARLEVLCRDRARRVPLPYLLGAWEFYGRAFAVTPAVLIPRPETEHLVECALRRSADRLQGARFLDVGTGSGCLAVTLALEVPCCSGVAADVSADALEVAWANAERWGAAGRLDFRLLDFPRGCEDLHGRLDLLLSNPPYVALGDPLPPEVADYEPRVALYAGATGLEFYRRLFAAAPRLLRPGGLVAVELGAGQGDAVRALALDARLTDIEVEPDLAGIPRVLSGLAPET